MTQTRMELLGKITSHEAVVAVIGLGYVGLPLAVAFAKAGLPVVGIDQDSKKIDAINAGHSYLQDISSDTLARFVQPANGSSIIHKGGLIATDNYAILTQCDASFICVPTPFDEHKTPDLSFIEAVSESMVPHLRPGHLVVLQSTTYPGTTEEVVKPILERSGLKAGLDFHLAFSPERIDPGNTRWTAENTPKVVGGLTKDCTRLAETLLHQINPHVHVVSSPRAAEMTKLLENTFRSVNIALVNELALLSERMNLDIWEVIDAAATKPFGFMPFRPGPGVGGHCIPIDPVYLSWKAREFDFYTRFIELASEANERMPFHVVDLVINALSDRGKGLRGAKVLLLGAAFKANVDDARNSPSQRVMELLLSKGAHVTYHDPHVPRFHLHSNALCKEDCILESTDLSDETLSTQDCVVILVGHRAVDYQRVVHLAPLLVDSVGITRGIGNGVENNSKIIMLGRHI